MKILRWMEKRPLSKISLNIHLARKKRRNSCFLNSNLRIPLLNVMDFRCMLILLNYIRKDFSNHTKILINQVKLENAYLHSTQISQSFKCPLLLKEVKWLKKAKEWKIRLVRSLLGIRGISLAILNIMILRLSQIQTVVELWLRSLLLILLKISTKALSFTRPKTHRHQHSKSIRFIMPSKRISSKNYKCCNLGLKRGLSSVLWCPKIRNISSFQSTQTRKSAYLNNLLKISRSMIIL